MNIMKGHMQNIDSLVVKHASFKLNDCATRANITYYIEGYLEDVVELIEEDYIVVCDNRNNPPDIVDRNLFRYDVVTYDDNGIINVYKHQLFHKNGVPMTECYIYE